MTADAFYLALTDIVRCYIEKRFTLRAAEQTTPEFLDSLGGDSRLEKAHRDMLREFLAGADVIKFARGESTQREMEASLEEARRFVVETMAAESENGIAAEEPAAAQSPGLKPSNTGNDRRYNIREDSA